jgi:hypothetical protein
MIRLRKLHISGFRGARFDLPLDFTKDLPECFDLRRERCEAALRNVLLGDKDSSVVSLEFSDADLNSSKTLGPNLKTATNNNSVGFKSFLEKAATERIFLRNAQITNIVAKTKGEKREWIAKIIGYRNSRLGHSVGK